MAFLGWGADEPDLEESREFVRKAREQRGKFIRVYDDVTGEELTKQEIRELEEARDSVTIPMFVDEYEDIAINKEYRRQKKEPKVQIEIKETGKKSRKTRSPIPSALRKAILQLHESKCVECGKAEANQIHHSDGNPSNNHVRNLILLCYDCHLKKHKKKVLVQD